MALIKIKNKTTWLVLILSIGLLIVTSCNFSKSEQQKIAFDAGTFSQFSSIDLLNKAWTVNKGALALIELDGDKHLCIKPCMSDSIVIRTEVEIDSLVERILLKTSVLASDNGKNEFINFKVTTILRSKHKDVIEQNAFELINANGAWSHFDHYLNIPELIDVGTTKGSKKLEIIIEIKNTEATLILDDIQLFSVQAKQPIYSNNFNSNGKPSFNKEKVVGFDSKKAKEDKTISNILHVDSNTSDDKVFASIGEALQVAITSNKRTKIIIKSGLYRESIKYQLDQPFQDAPLIIIEAEKNGEVIVSGSEVYNEWEKEGELWCTNWDNNWGERDQVWAGKGPWGNAGYIEPPGLRREMLFINGGGACKQVFDKVNLVENSFYVDEINDKIYLNTGNKDANKLKIEISERNTLLQCDNISNLIIRGITFQHAAKYIPEGSVTFNYCKNFKIDSCNFQWNNATGIFIYNCENITINNTKSIYNGWNGMTINFAKNIISTNNYIAHNTWRGHMGKIWGWDLAGNKNFNVQDYIIDNITVYDNLAIGIWFDYCCANVSVTNSTFIGNLSHGIFWEASQGPALIKNNCISQNGESGILNAEAWNLKVDNCSIYDNYMSQIELRVRKRDGFDNYSDPVYKFEGAYSTISNSILETNKNNSYLFDLYSMHDSSLHILNRYVKTFDGLNNKYYSSVHLKPFRFERHKWADSTEFNRKERGGYFDVDGWSQIIENSDLNNQWLSSQVFRVTVENCQDSINLKSGSNYNLKIDIENPPAQIKSIKVGISKVNSGNEILKNYIDDFNFITYNGEERDFFSVPITLPNKGFYNCIAIVECDDDRFMISNRLRILAN